MKNPKVGKVKTGKQIIYSPENDILGKQKSIPPFLGIVGDKKWSPFLDMGIPSPIFLHPKTAIFSDFGCKKMGLGTSGL